MANQPTTAFYTPSLGYQYNSTGWANLVYRLGVGQYRAYLPDMGLGMGIVHVAAYGGNHTCSVNGWPMSDTVLSDHTLEVNIRCFSASGTAVDGRFTMLFYKEARGAAWTGAYLWSDKSYAGPYAPGLQWNSKGLHNTVEHLGTGSYQVRLPGMNLPGGTVLVTAYGMGGGRCKVAGWSLSGNDTLVNVRCFDRSGAPEKTCAIR